MDSPSATGEPEPRRYGRRLFLVTVAGGISSLYWGKAAWDHVSSVVSPVANAVAPIFPAGGWRIYTISGRMPVFDPATWRLKIGGLVDQPLSLSYDELRALPRVEQVSDFHCVTGWSVSNVHWGGVRIGDVLAQAQPQASGHALRFVSMEVPYVDYLTLPQASAPRRAARVRDGRPAAAARARRPGAADHPGDVRLQERQVAAADRRRAARGRRLLGKPRLRPRRLDRRLEGGLEHKCPEPLPRRDGVKPGYVPRFSRVERLLHWVNAAGFFFLLVTGLILYLPRLSMLVSRRQLIQSIHFWGGVGWLGALAAVVLLGGRRLLADRTRARRVRR